jgi:HK97 family phage major capsid protein
MGSLFGDPANFLSRCDVRTVEGESLSFTVDADKDRSGGLIHGAAKAYWIAEADQITSSKFKTRKVKLEPQELAALIYATDKSLRNSPVALEQHIRKVGVNAINFRVGDAVIAGDGSGKPLGIKASGAVVSVSKETGQTAATIVSENVIKMVARLHPAAYARAVWLYNIECLPQLMQMTIGVGTAGVLTFLPSDQALVGVPPMQLVGRPMIPCEYCEALGTKGDIVLADFDGYLVGLRGGEAGGVRQATSIHLKFDYAETAFRFMWEIDGQPWLDAALTPYKGSSTLSQFVNLAARA